ncbi:MAG TPA: alkaline phosphatase family protein [Thermoanaerobaculia bacterium]|nr:alkaline phosphatase family protein [Thermoanaerobaculia bacterium]
MRHLSAAIVVLLIVLACALLFQLQPSGTATIYRSESRIIARTTPLFVRVIGAPACHVPMIGDRFVFDGSVPAEQFTAHVRFTYSVPPDLPGDWPAGDWCTSLARSIHVPGVPLGDLLDNRREAGDRVAAFIERDLRGRGVLTSGTSARIDVPAEIERLRPVPEIAKRTKHEKPVIFIGLDGADWNLLDGYMASGAMPNLKKLVAGSTRASLQSEVPMLSPIVWTTMMTGVSPLEHQILDFTRFNPVTHEKEPITSDERRAPAIWNELTYAGKSCAQFGLWATYAAEPLQSINVSDRLFTFLYSNPGQGLVYPPNDQPWAEKIAHGAENAITLQRVREFIPSATDAELKTSGNPYANPVSALRRILADTEIYRRLSLQYLATHRPDLTIVYFEGTDSIGHEFAPFAPPKQPAISQADFDRYSAVPEKYFRYIDTIIGDYFKFNAVVVIASDHGFFWSEGRPAEVSSTATATAAKWHAPLGIFVGPHGHAAPKTIRDVCAYLRRLTGIPDVDYDRFFTRAAPPPAPANPRANDEALAKLRALGYIGSNEATRPATAQNDTKTAAAYNNMGIILRGAHRADDAVSAFEHAIAIDPHYASAMWNLSDTLYQQNKDLDRSDALLIAAMQNGLADAPKFVIQRAIAYNNERSLTLLQSAVTVMPNNPDLHLFRGRFLLNGKKCSEALADFQFAEQSNNPLAFASAGLAQMCLGDKAGAAASFARAKQLDPTLQVPK